jgi:hypothetical protein
MDGLRRTGWLWVAAGLTLAGLAGCGSTGGAGQAAPTSTAPTQSTTGSTPTQGTPSQGTPTQSAPSQGTPSQGTPSQGTPTGTTSSATGPDRCHTAELRARLHALDSAAGQRYAALILTNRSTSTCRVYGYGGIQLLDAARRPVPTQQVRDPNSPPRLVSLRPGASAYSRLHWGVVPSGSESQTGPCEPTASYLLVTPPDETQPITVAWSYGMVCQRGRIEQTAYAPGTGPAF